jgi:hypothetical protein
MRRQLRDVGTVCIGWFKRKARTQKSEKRFVWLLRRLGHDQGTHCDEYDPRRGKGTKSAVHGQLDGFAVTDFPFYNGIYQMLVLKLFVLDGKKIFFFFDKHLVDKPGFYSPNVAHGNEVGTEIAGDFPIARSVINHLELVIGSIHVDFSLDVCPAIVDGPQGMFLYVTEKFVIHEIDINIVSCDVSCPFVRSHNNSGQDHRKHDPQAQRNCPFHG